MHSIYVYTDIYEGLKFFANSCIYIYIYASYTPLLIHPAPFGLTSWTHQALEITWLRYKLLDFFLSYGWCSFWSLQLLASFVGSFSRKPLPEGAYLSITSQVSHVCILCVDRRRNKKDKIFGTCFCNPGTTSRISKLWVALNHTNTMATTSRRGYHWKEFRRKSTQKSDCVYYALTAKNRSRIHYNL